MTDDPRYTLSKGQLFINDRTISFPYPVAQVILVKKNLIIRLSIPQESRFNRNVYALSFDGKTVWQIQESPHGGNVSKPFMNLQLTEDRRLIAGNWIGVDYEVDLSTGQIRAIKFTK